MLPLEGVLITGHEKGNIVVWHGIVQFYLSAVAQALRSRKSNVGAVEPEKSSKKHRKDKVKTTFLICFFFLLVSHPKSVSRISFTLFVDC